MDCYENKRSTNYAMKLELNVIKLLGPYSQNFLCKILKILVTLRWIREAITHILGI
jgi:hypothetical protein